MTDTAYKVTDLGPGDGGKGGVVHELDELTDTHTVIKDGAAQGNHGMRNSRGESFAFSQWGCGTLAGTRTHIPYTFTVSPEGLLNEAEALRYTCDIPDPFALLTVDEGALCATDYHGILSRLKELARGNNPRGTIGTGMGEAVRAAERHPELSFHVHDLYAPDLKDRIAAIREQVQRDAAPLIAGHFLEGDRGIAEKEIGLLGSDGFLDYIVRRFQEVARRANIVDRDYLRRVILPKEGSVIVESSHGILTDKYAGFHPHTSAIRTLPRVAHQVLAEAGFNGRLVNVGICRAYAIRHGAGPLPTADARMSEQLLPGSHKEDNRWQGKIRVGPIDLPLLRYSITACGGPSAFDILAITWFDQIQKNGEWRICRGYDGATDPTYFTPSGDLRVRGGEDEAQLAYQEALGHALRYCTPKIEMQPIGPSESRDTLFDRCNETLESALGVRVGMVSFGPTELDKICK